MAELVCWNPAKRYGLRTKGDLAPGCDADIVLVDPAKSFTIHAAESESQQGYTPFEGLEMSAQVTHTFLRGQLIYADGNVVGPARGQYLHRPYGSN
jgi:allantoinase